MVSLGQRRCYDFLIQLRNLKIFLNNLTNFRNFDKIFPLRDLTGLFCPLCYVEGIYVYNRNYLTYAYLLAIIPITKPGHVLTFYCLLVQKSTNMNMSDNAQKWTRPIFIAPHSKICPGVPVQWCPKSLKSIKVIFKVVLRKDAICDSQSFIDLYLSRFRVSFRRRGKQADGN